MRLIIISGLSGAGKSVALHALEDEGFYCMDNIPAEFVHAIAEKLTARESRLGDRVAISMDVRNLGELLKDEALPNPPFSLEPTLVQLGKSGIETSVVFIEADQETLLRRYSEVRRPHPLAHKAGTIEQAIEMERNCFEEILMNADLRINTTSFNHYQLRTLVRSQLCGESGKLALLIQSFGYKKGLPPGSDFVFDVRCLLNPYWEPGLREMTGRDAAVAQFLEADADCNALFNQILGFIDTWPERFAKDSRGNLTLSIGCTGGRHRSVYMVERLHAALKKRSKYRLNKLHRELPSSPP